MKTRSLDDLWATWVGNQTPEEFCRCCAQRGQTPEEGVREYVREIEDGTIFGPVKVPPGLAADLLEYITDA